jgi:hypothetical protein
MDENGPTGRRGKAWQGLEIMDEIRGAGVKPWFFETSPFFLTGKAWTLSGLGGYANVNVFPYDTGYPPFESWQNAGQMVINWNLLLGIKSKIWIRANYPMSNSHEPYPLSPRAARLPSRGFCQVYSKSKNAPSYQCMQLPKSNLSTFFLFYYSFLKRRSWHFLGALLSPVRLLSLAQCARVNPFTSESPSVSLAPDLSLPVRLALSRKPLIPSTTLQLLYYSHKAIIK